MKPIILLKLDKFSVTFKNQMFHIPNLMFDSAFGFVKAELL